MRTKKRITLKRITEAVNAAGIPGELLRHWDVGNGWQSFYMGDKEGVATKDCVWIDAPVQTIATGGLNKRTMDQWVQRITWMYQEARVSNG